MDGSLLGDNLAAVAVQQAAIDLRALPDPSRGQLLDPDVAGGPHLEQEDQGEGEQGGDHRQVRQSKPGDQPSERDGDQPAGVDRGVGGRAEPD